MSHRHPRSGCVCTQSNGGKPASAPIYLAGAHSLSSAFALMPAMLLPYSIFQFSRHEHSIFQFPRHEHSIFKFPRHEHSIFQFPRHELTAVTLPCRTPCGLLGLGPPRAPFPRSVSRLLMMSLPCHCPLYCRSLSLSLSLGLPPSLPLPRPSLSLLLP